MRYTELHNVFSGVLPLFHIYGQTSTLNASLYLGLTIRLWEDFEAEAVIVLHPGISATFEEIRD